MEPIKKNPNKFLVLICFWLFFAAAASAKAVEYEYTDVLPPGWAYAGGIGGGGDFKAFNHNINDNGVVVGSGYQTEFVHQQIRGFIYYEGTYTELLPTGWVNSMVHGINNRGEVFGDGSDAQGQSRSFIYKEDLDPYTELLPPGWLDAIVTGINDTGVALGLGRKEDIDDRDGAFVYKNGSYMPLRSPLFLPLPGVASQTFFNDINDYGTIVGNHLLCFGCGWGGPSLRFGFIYRDGIYTWLIPPRGFKSIETIAINNRGQVVGCGYEDEYEINCKAFIYRGGIYNFPEQTGWSYVWPSDINNHGEVVGSFPDLKAGVTNGYVPSKGFVYSKGTFTELLPPGWIDASGIAINNNGVIVGEGTDGNQDHKMFIADPQSD